MNDKLSEIVKKVRQAQSLLLLTHARADGDGLGSIAALAAVARSVGKKARCLVPDKMPERYGFLFPQEAPAGPDDFALLADESDLVIILDTCSFNQLDGLEADLRRRRDKVVVIDHHITADDVGCVQWIDSSAAAAGVLTMELIEAMGWTISPAGEEFSDPANALATAITSDTGWMRFANTDPRCLRWVARLLELGVRPDRLYAKLFQTDRPERLRLMSRMLSSLELHCGGKLSTMCIRKTDFAATGARSEETENLVNEALRIGTVESAVLLVENGDLVRVSLRSRDVIDVAAVAKTFGGGGHARAAGIRSPLGVDALRAKLVEAFEREFRRIGALA